MSRLIRVLALGIALVATSTALAGSGTSTVSGIWRKLPTAPLAIPQNQTSVWTGRQVIVFGRSPQTNPSGDVAEAYDPNAHSWKRLSPPKGPDFTYGYASVWTGTEMLAFGSFHSAAYNPATGRWRELRRPSTVPGGIFPGGIVVWTGREAIGWGGGCCGDAWSNGAAYNPTTGTYRNLPRSPLAGSQHPLGAWTGRELVLFVSRFDPDGKLYPADLARAAAYNPTTNAWRLIAPLPVTGARYQFYGAAVWDGREILVTGTGAKARSAFAYDPTTNHWRRLAPLPASRVGGTAVWTGKQLFVWGGQRPGATASLAGGLAYDPASDRWSTIPRAPLQPRSGSAVQWTGHELVVWGGAIPRRVGAPTYVRDGAAFEPAAQ